MHYIRFLKPPFFTRHPKSSQAFQVKAKITITSDLGEYFLGVDLPLEIGVADSTRRVRVKVLSEWKGGARQLDICVDIPVTRVRETEVSSISGELKWKDTPNWPCQLFIKARSLQDYTLRDFINPSPTESLVSPRMTGAVLPVYSEWLQLSTVRHTKMVERKLRIGQSRQLNIWEETGESIARHIWDAGVVLSAILLKISKSEDQAPTDLQLPLLCAKLSKSDLKVLELGAGCGIVGITLSQCLPDAQVTITDLPDAEDIATHNILATATISIESTSATETPNISYQNLDWVDPLPDSLQCGDLDLVLVADCTYNSDVVPDLVKMLAALVACNQQALICLAMKVRHESEVVFFELMEQSGLQIADKLVVPLAHMGEEDQEIDIYLFKKS